MTQWQLSVPATSANLGPGFDFLGLALDMRLTLTAKPTDEFQLRLTGFGRDQLPTNEENLLIKSYQYACQTHHWPIRKLGVSAHNPIPICSGLGSSAAAIVIGLALAREVHGKPWHRDHMLQEAVTIEGHPDNVAPAIFGGLISCENGPKGLQPLRRALAPSIHLLTATPPEVAKTETMRKFLPNPQPAKLIASHREMVDQLLEALAKADPQGMKLSSHDQLHQPYRLSRLPMAKAIFQIFRSHPSMSGAFLSGSGPTIAGWVIGANNPEARIKPLFYDQKIIADFRFLRPDQDGVRREGTHLVCAPV